MKISIIIPAFNEEKRISSTLGSILSYLNRREFRAEIIVVDDGSNDRTVQVVSRYMNPFFPVVILRQEKNSGKGEAVRRGMLCSTGDAILFTDADLSTPINELDKFIPELSKGNDIVIGSRAHPESKIETRQPYFREFMGRVFNTLVRLVALPGINDTQCGFKLFSRRSALHLFNQQVTKGFAFDVEILYLARKAGYRIKELPVKWMNDENSKVRIIRDPLMMLYNVIMIRYYHSRFLSKKYISQIYIQHQADEECDYSSRATNFK